MSTTARVYLKSKRQGQVVVALGGTSYELHLVTSGAVEPSPQGRVRGTIRGSVWKVDFVNRGGAYIEPVYGRPRRVQGRVTATLPQSNSVVVEVAGQPIVGDLPARWQASEIAIGTRVALDFHDGARFEAETTQAAPTLAPDEIAGAAAGA